MSRTQLAAAIQEEPASVEEQYYRTAAFEHRKRLGQVFTPPKVALLMADWALGAGAQTALDPAFGTGVLAAACAKRLPGVKITGYELDENVLEFVPPDVAKRSTIITEDFLKARIDGRFDAVVMNPPYIRHREIVGYEKARSQVSALSLCPIPRSANLYVYFVLKALTVLPEGGRGAFLIPAEWMSANFSTALKKHLLESGYLKHIVLFSHCSNVFDGALTTASVLLVEKSKSSRTVASSYLESISFEDAPSTVAEVKARFPSFELSHDDLIRADKWEPLLRGEVHKLPDGWTRLETLASTRRGIATGSNSFFLISQDRANELGISKKSLLPCVGRATDVTHYVFSKDDYAALKAEGGRCFLVNMGTDLTAAEAAYVKRGEEEGVAERYLCAARKPWYSMEQRDVASIWATVFGRGDLEFVFNEAATRSLTNFHCVYPNVRGDAFARALTLVLNSKLVREQARLHTRGYGGGLNKFEPNDLKSIPVPDLRLVSPDTIERLSKRLGDLDECSRKGVSPAAAEEAANQATEEAGREAAGGRTRLL